MHSHANAKPSSILTSCLADPLYQIPPQDLEALQAIFEEFDMRAIEPDLHQAQGLRMAPELGWVNLMA